MILMKNQYDTMPNYLTFSIYIGNKEECAFFSLEDACKYMIKSLRVSEEEARKVKAEMQKNLNNPRANIVNIRVN